MMDEQPQTSWIWGDDSGGTQGATADLDTKTIMWFEAPGCACGGADDAQPIADFLERGSRFVTPPDDVLAEMRAALSDYA